MQVLLVEDDPRLAAMLQRGLREDEHSTVWVTSAEQGLVELSKGTFDICVLDVTLPGIDGFEAVKRLRQSDRSTPVLMLTARDAVEDRVKGLTLGADDYLAKPFAFTELLARIGALGRRAPRRNERLSVGKLTIDGAARTCTVAEGLVLELSARQFELLELFARNRDQVVTRAMVLAEVFGYSFVPSANIVDVHVSNLRQKLARVESGVTITTVRGVGYRLEESP